MVATIGPPKRRPFSSMWVNSRRGPPAGDARSGSAGLEEAGELLFVEHGYAQLGGLLQLRVARFPTGHQVGRLLRNAPRGRAPPRLDGLDGALSGETVEGAGDHERLPGQRLGNVGRGRALEVDARLPELLDHLPVALGDEEFVNTLGDD